METIPFDLNVRYTDTEGFALWLRVDRVLYLINPFALTDSLFCGEGDFPLILMDPDELRSRIFSVPVTSSNCFTRRYYWWNVQFPDGEKRIWAFDEEEYEDRVFEKVAKLGRLIIKITCGRPFFTRKDAEDLLLALTEKAALLGPGAKKRQLFDIEPFSMKLVAGKTESPEEFEIKIGEETIPFSADEEDAAFEAWREALEHYFFTGDTTLYIFTDCDPYVISIRNLEHWMRKYGYREPDYNHGDAPVLVNVSNEKYSRVSPLVTGFCREDTVIREIYTSLHDLAAKWDATGPDEQGRDRLPIFTSPKIEQYLTDNERRKKNV